MVSRFIRDLHENERMRGSCEHFLNLLSCARSTLRSESGAEGIARHFGLSFTKLRQNLDQEWLEMEIMVILLFF